MADSSELMYIKYAIDSFRQRFNTELDLIEALVDRALPDDPGPGIRVPQGREARKKFWKERGIRDPHGRKIA